jgi:hypothetical protein
MLFEIIIALQLIAFLFLILGMFPYSKTADMEGNEGKPPFFNKLIFIMIGGIIFWSLGLLTNAYDYNYCYINQTTSDFSLNMTLNQATCGNYQIQSPDLSYLNMGMGFLSILLFIIVALFAVAARKEVLNND